MSLVFPRGSGSFIVAWDGNRLFTHAAHAPCASWPAARSTQPAYKGFLLGGFWLLSVGCRLAVG